MIFGKFNTKPFTREIWKVFQEEVQTLQESIIRHDIAYYIRTVECAENGEYIAADANY